MSRVRVIVVTVLCTLAALAVLGTVVARALPLQQYAMKQAIPTNFFEPESAKGPLFEQVQGPVYAYRHGINRSLVLDTPEGLAVIDTFHAHMAEALREELRRRFPGKPVRWVLYSHYHLDHVEGAAVLEPQEVIAHASCERYWNDLGVTEVLRPTRTVQGDQVLSLGGIELRLLDLGLSHTDTLYAFFLPQQRVLYSPDVGFVRTLPPFGLPDFYYPGYLQAMDRLAQLDFEHFVPSHFERGTRQDFIDHRTFLAETRQMTEVALRNRGGVPTSGIMVRDIFDEVYPQLQRRYGTWHGFDAMFVPIFVRHLGGAYLGH